MELKFFICEHCGNIVTYVRDNGVPVMCCGQKMTELKANVTDGAHEKHVPVVSLDGRNVLVKIGEAEHPMVEQHFIQWIALETREGVQIKYLKPEMKPEAEFVLSAGDELIAAYEYCNLHGLWKKEA